MHWIIKKIIICTNTLCSFAESKAKNNTHPDTKYYISGVNNVDMIHCWASNCVSFKDKYY